MLSYRHSFHAGNFADVLKHTVLAEILRHLIKKEKPIAYIDTHAGAGLFSLQSEDAEKLGEYRDGIARVINKTYPEMAGYLEVVKGLNKPGLLTRYPGSPVVAGHFLRRQDHAWLYELHPQDHVTLSKNIAASNMAVRKNVTVQKEDGLKGFLSLLPPVSRRGLVLIDPSYEVKTEYDQVVVALEKAHKKFSTGVYALWYPVVERERIDRLERRLIATGIRNIQQFELGVRADATEQGMTSSGMIVINPPWGLLASMQAVLPKLAKALAQEEKPVFRCRVLVDE